MKLKILPFLLMSASASFAQKQTFHYTIDMKNAIENEYQIQLNTKLEPNTFIDLSIPVWSPGYYQIMDFGKNVNNFDPKNQQGETLRWVKLKENTWRIFTNFSSNLNLNYAVKANRNFVGTAYIDQERIALKLLISYLKAKFL